MSCFHPLQAFDTGQFTSNGKREIIVTSKYKNTLPVKKAVEKFGHEYEYDSSRMVVDNGVMCFKDPIEVPCGRCIGCRLDYTSDWAVRCCLEASLYPGANWFVTLTYDDYHLPSDFKVSKRELQLFMKKLRKRYGENIRFFACGEYGEQSLRPHYHLILFNFMPTDLRVMKATSDGVYYTSQELSKIWAKGYVLIGDVTFKSCAYVARYAMKGFKDAIPGFEPFLLMSRRPGIGHDWIVSNWIKVYNTDKIYYDFGDSHYKTSNRYFDSYLDKLHPELLEGIKNARTNASMIASISDFVHSQCESVDEMRDKLEKTKKRQVERLKRIKN